MRRLFLLVAAVVLVDTMFFAAITPLLPEYVSDLGLSKTAAGILSAAYAAGTLIGSLPAGWLAARAGVRPTILLGLGLMSAASVTFAFADQIVVLDVARFAQGLGGACSWSAGLAWLVAAAPAERRGELIGSALAAAIGGVLLGPILGGAATVIGDEPVFCFVAVLGIALAIWTRTMPAPAPSPVPRIREVARALTSPRVVAPFWMVMLPALFAGVIVVLAPLRLDELGASGIVIGGVFLVAAGVEAIVTRKLGGVSDRTGRMVPIRVGLAAMTVAALLLPLPGHVLPVALAVIVSVVALAFLWAPAMALLSEATEAMGIDQGFAFALTNLAWAGGEVVGGSGGGALADVAPDAVAYAIVAALSAATVLVLLAGNGWRFREPAASPADG
jgi:MFS family permease